MSKTILTVLLIVCFSGIASHSTELPSSATYVFYIQGEYAGKCAIDLAEDGDLVVFKSTTDIHFDDYKLALTSRTEIEKGTLRPRFFEYEGVRMGKKISGTTWSEGDSIAADNAIDGEHFPSGARFDGAVYLFENYVSEHQIVLAWAIDKSKEPFMRFNVLLPSEFITLPSLATLDSEIELPTAPNPTVCKKYGVAMKNSGPYYTYYDPKRRMPVYMDFPSANTEVFLEGTYEGTPQTKYVRPEEPK